MCECNKCKHWKDNGCVVLKGCSRFEPGDHPSKEYSDLTYWEELVSDGEKTVGYGKG